MPRFLAVSYLLLVILMYVTSRSVYNSGGKTFNEENKMHWNLQAQRALRAKLTRPLNTRVAKNVIFFLGDGMSITTMAATRVYLGQKFGHYGEELKMMFEDFPFTGLTRTYCIDQNVADAACSGTAYLAGVKANSGTLGVSAAIKRGDCQRQRDGQYSVPGLMTWAQRAGKGTGVVTTSRVTHATTAASYAHSADRNWEADSDLPNSGMRCDDIASQLVRGDVGSKIDVVLGGGRKYFFPKTERDPEGKYGYRSDGADLIKEWSIKKESLGAVPKYVYHKDALLSLDVNIYNSVLGLFSSDHMPYHLDAGRDDPTLSEMALKALIMLAKRKTGFFLFVEGGRIDDAHHESKARKALDETAEFAKAIKDVINQVDFRETLVVVTSNHGSTLSYSGYSKRGSDILGLTNQHNASDGLPYTTLSYATGPGIKLKNKQRRYNLSTDNFNLVNYSYPSLVPMKSGTHGGEDVAVYAKGPWAHLFTGNYEQNFLPHAIAYASCIGPRLTNCHIR